MQDFSQKWTDELLYQKYDLSQDEIEFIESMMKEKELDGGTK
jgi:site-specific DNA-methyltransferase (adenine-specific)